MCLGVPMEVLSVDGYLARCGARGVERDVNLLLLQHELPQVGDHVLVHVGYAIQTLSAEEAQSTWEALDEALALMDAEAGAPA